VVWEHLELALALWNFDREGIAGPAVVNGDDQAPIVLTPRS
jgi:hypothetical protein